LPATAGSWSTVYSLSPVFACPATPSFSFLARFSSEQEEKECSVTAFLCVAMPCLLTGGVLGNLVRRVLHTRFMSGGGGVGLEMGTLGPL